MRPPDGGTRPQTVADVLRLSAEWLPGRVALKCGGTQLTYGELGRAAEECGRRLRSVLGGEGGHVALLIGNSVEYVVAYFAAASAGAVIVPLNPSAAPERLDAELDYCDVRCLITTPAHEHLLRGLAARPVRRLSLLCGPAAPTARGYTLEVYTARGRARRPGGDGAGRAAAGAAILLPTSGTGGVPKRVVLSHDNLLSNVAAFLEAAELREDDTGLIALPLMSSGTNTAELLAYLRRGLTVVLYPHPVFLLGEYCKLLQDEAVTVANVTPLILRLAMGRGGRALAMMAGVRKIFFASSPMSAHHFTELTRALPATRFYYGYGLTEASPRCTMLLPQFAHTKAGSAGAPLRGVEVRVADPGRRPLGPGSVGEIAVRGPNVMRGYYKRPEATAAVLSDSWLYTGDLGYLDEDGFLYVKGRADNVIVTRGVNVCPEEVEEALQRHGAVREAYVAGVPDELTNQEVVAYVVRRAGARCGAAELRDFLRRTLEPAKVPRRIVFVPGLPHNSNLKLVRGQAAGPPEHGL